MNSYQIHTAPLVRNFATRIDESCVQVTTKLGTQTLVRANFMSSSFPDEVEGQIDFLQQLIRASNPGALDLLQEVAVRCLEDARSAVATLLAAESDRPC